MKSLLQLCTTMAQDMGLLLGVDPTRDIITMTSRFLHEGDSFLTITLPSFEDGFLASLESGRISPSSFPSFRFRGCLPVFLRGFTEKVFAADGSLLVAPSSDAVFAVRQITAFLKKVEYPVTQDRLVSAEKRFRATDEEIGDIPDHRISELRCVFESLFMPVLDKLENAIANFQLIPRHGPGAVAERRSASQKWEFLDWLESIDDVFPSTLYSSHDGRKSPVPVVPLELEPPVRVAFVPKTMRTPRVIAIEPYARQFVQQAVARFLYDNLRTEFPAQLDLFDQRTNDAWAWSGSIDRGVSTIDLSEASDRLSHQLVTSLFRRWPHISDALVACRSARAELPSGDLITLKKFASMGSALTFPIQSMVFFSIAVLGEFGSKVYPGYRRSVRNDGCISVFGDDIIVKTDAYQHTVSLLESYGLKVNVKKSYYSGNFRESCGGDYFNGCDVSITRLRKPLPTSRADAQEVSSLVSFRNLCYGGGLWTTAALVDEILTGLISWRPAPFGHPSLSRWTYLDVGHDGYNDKLQIPIIRRPKLVPIARSYKPDGLSGLLKWFLESLHSSERSPFEPSERPAAFAIHSRGWPLEF